MASAVASTSTCVVPSSSSASSSAPRRAKPRLALRIEASDDSDFVPVKSESEDDDDGDGDDDGASSHSEFDAKLDSDDDDDLLSDQAPRKKSYKCDWPGCGRAYVRPIRLDEHKRSHTGERPFECSECDATFARESHLRAHERTHASESDKPFECTDEGCDKRFWTGQHLKAHVDSVHRGVVGRKTYDCTRCGKSFRKRRLLSEHLTVAHDVPAGKPLACSHCDKTFKQKHHLKQHEKTHDLSRYACLHPDCASKPFAERQFGVWSALQKHTKQAHPPRCHYPQCAGKTFTTSFGLRTHLKLHAADEEAGIEALPEGRKRRSRKRARTSARGGRGRGRGGAAGEGAVKLEDADDERASDWEDRQEAERDERMRENFRHGGKKKRKVLEEAHGFPPIPPGAGAPASSFYRDLVTGANYAHRASSSSASASATAIKPGDDRPRPGLTHVPRQFACPFPAILALPFEDVKEVLPGAEGEGGDDAEGTCGFWFKRVYDVERHLRSRHGVEMVGGRRTLDTWFEAQREAEETADEA